MQDYNSGIDLYEAAEPKQGGMPGWVIALLAVGGVMLLGCLGVCGGLMYLGASSPDTFVYSSNQVPPQYIDSAKRLGLVDNNESVLYFYSDAMLDVEDAMYILTDQHLVLHNTAWSDTQRIITFNEIASVGASWSSDWLTDSMVAVQLSDGSSWSFPLSMENDTDHRFVEKLCELAGVPTPP